jgi:hypothetical protein
LRRSYADLSKRIISRYFDYRHGKRLKPRSPNQHVSQRQVIRKALIAEASKPNPRSALAVAREHGMARPTDVYQQFPKEASAIAQRLSAEELSPRLARMRELVAEALASKRMVPMAAFVRSSGVLTLQQFLYRLPELHRTYVAELKSRATQERARRMERLRCVIVEEAASESPRSLDKLCHEHGFHSVAAVVAAFPAECEALQKRREELVAARKARVRSCLAAALLEEPPPTLREVERRLNTTAAVLYKVDRGLCTELVNRRQTHVLEIKRKRRARRDPAS